jgi:glycosyltransferase involved in cell wall biosynthesis
LAEEAGTGGVGGAGSTGQDRPGVVSVVIIFLNEERFLAESIESVLAQDHPYWELLLVDDGSTDGSAGIARGYAHRDPRIRYLCHPGGANLGMSASRNLGLAHATGEYVAFLDADDVYLPRRLSRHVAVLRAHPGVAMVGSSYFRWFPAQDGGPAEVLHPRTFVAPGDQFWEPPVGLIIVTAVPFMNMGTCSVTVRRRVALAVGGFEHSFASMYEDQVFAAKILARHSVYVMQAYLARYRHHPGSTTRRASAVSDGGARARADASRYVDWLLGYLGEQGIGDPLLLEVVRKRRPAVPDPGAGARLRAGLAHRVKTTLERALPAALYRRLLVLDYQFDGWQARRAYRRLVAALGQQAPRRAQQGEAGQGGPVA